MMSQSGQHFLSLEVEPASVFGDDFCFGVEVGQCGYLSVEVGLLGAATNSGIDNDFAFVTA